MKSRHDDQMHTDTSNNALWIKQKELFVQAMGFDSGRGHPGIWSAAQL